MVGAGLAAGMLLAGSVNAPASKDAGYRLVLVKGLAAEAMPAESEQAPGTLLPDQSTAKAKDLIQRAIQALGGQAYLSVKDITRSGRFAQFGHTGDLTGYVQFYDYVKLPDKNRTEYFEKRNIISVYNGEQGWELDRGGVVEASTESLKRFQEGLKKDVDTLFRSRLNEEGITFRYGSTDILDLKQVEWVEVVDRERRTMRIALEVSTHLPIRAVYLTRDPATRQRVEEIEFFSNYHPVQGVQTPFQISRERNGLKVFQVFFKDCQYNTNLPDSFFTRESLDQRWAQLNKGKKKKS